MHKKSKDGSRDVSNIDLPYPSVKVTNQTREIGIMEKKDDFDRNDEMNPFVEMASSPRSLPQSSSSSPSHTRKGG